MNAAFLQKVAAGALFILWVVTFVAHLVGHPDSPQPVTAPAMTTQQAYDQICGQPDVCASMHNFIQQVEAEKQSLEITPAPAPADPAAPDQTSEEPDTAAVR